MNLAGALCALMAGAAVATWLPVRGVRLLSGPRTAVVPAGQRSARRRQSRSGRLVATPRSWQHRARLERSAARTLPGRVLRRARRSWRARPAAAQRRAQVVELCTAISAGLRAGAVPGDALDTAVRSVPGLCDEVGRVSVLGGDAVEALRAASTRPGATGLSRLAAAWTVTELTGSGLADGCDRVADWLRDEETLRREVAAQLAGARASARLLAVLPLFGLALGTGIGGDPVAFLVGTPYGLVCLLVGTALASAGLWWTEQLARSVEAQL